MLRKNDFQNVIKFCVKLLAIFQMLVFHVCLTDVINSKDIVAISF